MRIEKVFDIIQIVLRKETKGFIHVDKMISAVEMACAELYEELLGEYHTSRVMPFPLRAFMKSTAATFAAGVEVMPSDFYQLTSFATSTARADEVMTDEEWDDIAFSALIAPTTAYPLVKVSGDPITGFSLNILPASITTGTAKYLAMPTSWFVYDVTYAGDQRSWAFAVGTSTDMLFGESEIKRIIALALPYLGVSIQDKSVLDLGQLKANQ